MDLENYQVDISVDLPYLTFDGAYEVSGRLLVLPLKGKGPVKANASEYSIFMLFLVGGSVFAILPPNEMEYFNRVNAQSLSLHPERKVS